MFKNICDVIVMIVSIMMEVELFKNLLIIRNNKCEESKLKINLRKSRMLIIAIIVLYSVYGVVRNIA